MPRLTVIDGVEVYMYFKDHAPPHVHGIYGDAEVVVALRDGEVVAGSIPPAKLTAVRAYVAENAAELLEKWNTFGGAGWS